MKVDYIRVDGFSFPSDTDKDIIKVICNAYRAKQRIRLFYCARDGVSWCESFGTIGYIGKTTGNQSPILLLKSSSLGGELISLNVIGKITIDKETVYKRSDYRCDLVISESDNTKLVNGIGVTIYQSKTEEEAKRALSFYMGERNKI